MTAAVRTTCAYCGVGCGILARPTGPRTAEIAGDPDHPANRGRLCSKGMHLGETIGLEGRLLHPMIGSRRASWDRALALVARRFTETIAAHGPDSVAFYVSGQLLTEDYYVANKLMKGFIGSANIDTNSRLCMASAVAGHIRAFGEDVVPAGYDDLEAAELILLIGSNAAWCHPVLHQRIVAARAANGTKLVVIDPRRTETADEADLHLAIRPGSDVALINGLLAFARAAGLVDQACLARSVSVPAGFWEGIQRQGDLRSVARTCDVAPADLQRLFDLFAAHPRTITLFSMGINQSTRGTDQVNAILNLHLATGRIGKPGAAPFSITGQPNAMGGREVGGLATALAAHMDFSPDHVASVGRFWAAPNMATKPGLKAVDLFRSLRDGRIKALWVMATNPAASLPDAAMVRDALAGCPFLVVSDCVADTDTGRFAHVRLPAAAWGEKDGTVTNSERTVSRQRAFLPMPGEARPDWWIVAEVARRMGWKSAFSYDVPADIFREHARLTAYRNDGRRQLDLRDKVAIGNHAYAELAPFRWGGDAFADGIFPTDDGKARLVAVEQAPLPAPLAEFPLTLNTGRYRDQWHTMTRTGLSPRLSRHRPEPLLEMHPDDAESVGLSEGDLVRISTPQGSSIFRTAISDRQRRGELFAPIHWTDRQSTLGRTGLLTAPTTDPHSGQPGFKRTPARIDRVAARWSGFLVSRESPPAADGLLATRIRVPGGWRVELAGDGDPLRAALRLIPQGATVEASDPARGRIAMATVNDGRLAAALQIASGPALPPREWLTAQLAEAEAASAVELLAGRPAAPRPDSGAIVCICFDVGRKAMTRAIAEQRLDSVEAVGAAIRAGTSCGSCRPEIRSLIAADARREA